MLIGYLTMRAYRDGKSFRKDQRLTLLTRPLQRIHWTDARFPSLVDLRVVYWTMNDPPFSGSLDFKIPFAWHITALCTPIIPN